MAGQRVSSTRDVSLAGQVHVYAPPTGGGYNPELIGGEHWVYRDAYYSGERRESFGYGADGQLTSVGIAETNYYDDGDGHAVSTGTMDRAGGSAEFQHDGMGRQVRQIDRNAGGHTVYDHQQQLSASGRADHDVTHRLEGGVTLTTDTWNDYGANGVAAQGQIVSATTTSSRGNQSQGTTTVTNSYDWRNGNAQIAWTQTSGQSSSFTQYNYGMGGRLESIGISDGRSRTVGITSDLSGQALVRDETDGNAGQGDPHERWYRFNGNELGHVGNDGGWMSDYAGSIQSRGWATQNGPFGNNRRYGNDFAEGVDRITSYEQGASGGGYTVRSGDTLAGIAAQVWGDASLWYKLAAANGLGANAALTAGQTLTLPAGVVRSTYNAAQLRPYDPADAIGDVSPVATQPTARGRNNKCGAFGKILLVAVAVAVTALTAGATAAALAPIATTAAGGGILGGLSVIAGGTALSAGALVGIGVGAGIAGSVASQGLGLATGIQDKFSWKDVALAGIAGGVAGGLGASGILSGGKGLTAALNAAGRGALSNVATQGVAMATGLQGRFDWAGVAVGAAVAAAGGAIRAPSLGRVGGRVLSGMAGALAGAATRSIADGTSFGDNILAALPDVIGSTIGNAIAGRIGGGGRSETSMARLRREGGVEYAQISDPGVRSDSVESDDIIVTARKLGENAVEKGRGLLDWVDGWLGTNLGGDNPRAKREARARSNIAVTFYQPGVRTGSGYDRMGQSLNGRSDYDAGAQFSNIISDASRVSLGTTLGRLGEWGTYTVPDAALRNADIFDPYRGMSPEGRVMATQLDRLRGGTIGGIATGVAIEFGADPALQDLVYGLGSSADGLLIAGGAMGGARVPGIGNQPGLSIVNGRDGVHANSRSSSRTTYLYELRTSDGEFLKYGISVNPDTRYLVSFMVGKRIYRISSGTRSDMIDLEKQMVISNPGPLNHELWANKARKGN